MQGRRRSVVVRCEAPSVLTSCNVTDGVSNMSKFCFMFSSATRNGGHGTHRLVWMPRICALGSVRLLTMRLKDSSMVLQNGGGGMYESGGDIRLVDGDPQC